MQTEENQDQLSEKHKIDQELDRFEKSIEKLRIEYEQFFSALIPPPDEAHKEILKFRRYLLNRPFKTTATNYRLRTLMTRLQTYSTYWERVNKQREAGTYRRDKFRANVKLQHQRLEKKAKTAEGKAEKGINQLFKIYKEAIVKNGGHANNIDFNKFKKSLVSTSKKVKEKTGAKKLSYKIQVKNGKVSLKASPKENS